MKRYFFTGLALLLPFTLTIVIVMFLVNILTKPFQEFVESTLNYYDIMDQPFLFFSGAQVLYISSKLLVLGVLLGVVLVIGFLGQMVLLKGMIYFGELVIHRIPMINVIYKLAKEVINSLFSSKSNNFSQVVLIPYPYPGVYSIALVAADQRSIHDNSPISVFVPTALNITIGYMISVRREELIYIDMKVEDALKCVVSCGIMFPKFEVRNEPNTLKDISSK